MIASGHSDAGWATEKVRIFVSYDREHDRDLFDLLLDQSGRESLGFEVSDRSDGSALKDPDDPRLRRRICEADQVIVICGEHTDVSMSVFAELRIAQQEQKPYFLLWGRRELMCTKPAGAKSSEGIYGWTPQILQDQVTLRTRSAHREASASRMKRPK